MAEHTELPWAIADGEGCERIVVERGTNNILFVLREPYGRMPIPQDAQIPANAAFIVKACNSHEALVKQVRRNQTLLQSLYDKVGAFSTRRCIDEMLKENVSVIGKLEAALLAAREVKP